MIRGPGASNPKSALSVDLESIRAPHWICVAFSSSCPDNSESLLSKPVHLDSPIHRMMRLNFLISVATWAVFAIAYMVKIFHILMVAVVLVEIMVFGLMAFTCGVIPLSAGDPPFDRSVMYVVMIAFL
ncbi:hypothetical protein DPMN_067925 [Dreissena polymorpha]|uniref:Uncharacterized protein n=1 Tax=Dreissena polymorpha TaxID=45954 RepID=A0A9D3YW59_DREPO|nr:hypothetical protein DPMN_067925 [Dreissena polymorpha]